jgi:hypothetical protein
MKVAIIAILAILMTPLATHVLAQTDDSTITSSVRVDGFIAQEDLTAILTWGNTTLEKKVERGSTSVEFEIPRPNIRSNMTIMIQPDGLELSLNPTALGYTPVKMSLGPKLVLAEALKVVVKEVLVVLDLEIVVRPAKMINKLTVDDKSVAFAVETSGGSIIVKPSSGLIIDLQKSIYVMVEGDDFKSTLVIRRGLSENEISVWGEAMGNVKEIVVRARAAEVLATQEVMIPLKLLNVTMVLKGHEPLRVAFAKEESKKEGAPMHVTTITNQSPPQGGRTEEPPFAEGLMTLLRWKLLFLAVGAFSICLAVAFNKKWLALLAMALLALYFATTFIGMGGGM